MKRKIFVRILLIVVLVIVILLLLLLGVSRLYYGRSIMATVAELWLRIGGNKAIFTDPERCQSYIEAKAETNLEPYVIPESVSFDVTVEERQEQGMQVFFLNEQSQSDTLIFYIHGGAYINNPSSQQWKLCNRISKDLDVTVILPVYPKIPVYTCDDAYAAMLALYQDYASDAETIIFMGDSAGGGLALGLAQELRDLGERQPDQLILFSPWIDASMDNQDMEQYEDSDPMLGIYGLREMGAMWADTRSVYDPRVSPIYGSMDGLGKITLFVGTREIFYPEIMRLSTMLDEQGISHNLFIGQGLNHVYTVYPIPEAEDAAQTIEALIAENNS